MEFIGNFDRTSLGGGVKLASPNRSGLSPEWDMMMWTIHLRILTVKKRTRVLASRKCRFKIGVRECVCVIKDDIYILRTVLLIWVNNQHKSCLEIFGKNWPLIGEETIPHFKKERR